MPASNTKIKKICEWCGTRFEAQKISTKYCSHRCANLAYKKEKERKTLRLLKRILKIGLRNYLSSQLRIKSFYLSQRLEFF